MRVVFSVGVCVCDLLILLHQVLPFGKLTPYEQGWFDKMIPDLQKQIAKGEEYTKSA